jgi:serine/threonine protein kinase
MNLELERIAHLLSQAGTPEDVFGKIDGTGSDPLTALRRVYHSLAKNAHPDACRWDDERILAQATFRQLTEWFGRAEEKVRSGSYGRQDRVILRTKARQYEIETRFKEDQLFNYYPCTFREDEIDREASLRVVRDPLDNDISANEIHTLQTLRNGRESLKFSPYIPNLIDSFIYDDGLVSRQAAVFEKQEGWYSLEQVHGSYPNGVDPKDMAWMWRRVLVALGFAHINGVIHGAILPANIWIQPEQHGLMLMNWFHALHANSGDCILKIDPDFTTWYPREITKHEAPTFGTDISMSAKCMIYLIGGDAERGTIPNSIPHAMQRFLKGSILPGGMAPQEAWTLKREFDDLLDRLWGARTFHPFKLN